MANVRRQASKSATMLDACHETVEAMMAQDGMALPRVYEYLKEHDLFTLSFQSFHNAIRRRYGDWRELLPQEQQISKFKDINKGLDELLSMLPRTQALEPTFTLIKEMSGDDRLKGEELRAERKLQLVISYMRMLVSMRETQYAITPDVYAASLGKGTGMERNRPRKVASREAGVGE